MHYRKWVICLVDLALYSINGRNASMTDFEKRISAGNFTSLTAGN
jgi:hypothetical protein